MELLISLQVFGSGTLRSFRRLLPASETGEYHLSTHPEEEEDLVTYFTVSPVLDPLMLGVIGVAEFSSGWAQITRSR